MIWICKCSSIVWTSSPFFSLFLNLKNIICNNLQYLQITTNQLCLQFSNSIKSSRTHRQTPPPPHTHTRPKWLQTIVIHNFDKKIYQGNKVNVLNILSCFICFFGPCVAVSCVKVFSLFLERICCKLISYAKFVRSRRHLVCVQDRYCSSLHFGRLQSVFRNCWQHTRNSTYTT